MKELTHGSLFSGIGGFELGAEWSGIETLWTSEINNFNRKQLHKLYPKSISYGDIKKMFKPAYVDIISGGFPCQNISIAASRDRSGIDGEKSGMFWEMLRIVKEVKPKYVVIENSSALRTKGLDRILTEFAEMGYDAEWQTLQGYQFGIPQRRRRLYAIFYPVSLGDRMEERQIFTGWNKPKYPTWRDSEPKIYGVADVIPDRVAKHRALGNAVQPLIAHYLFECIKKYENKIHKSSCE